MRNIQQELVVNRHHILHAENAIENLRYHQNRNEDLQTERRKKKAGKESEIKDKAENVDNREIRQTIKENGKEQELEQTKSPMRPEGGTVKQRDDEDGILHTMDGGLQNKEKEHSIYNINNTQEKNETEQEFIEVVQETEDITDNGNITNTGVKRHRKRKTRKQRKIEEFDIQRMEVGSQDEEAGQETYYYKTTKTNMPIEEWQLLMISIVKRQFKVLWILL